MDNIKNYITRLENTIENLSNKRKTKYEELKNSEKRLSVLKAQKDLKNVELTEIQEVIELSKNKRLFILKDELVAIIMILTEVTVMCLTFPELYGIALFIINWVGTIKLDSHNKEKNKVLIDYYKKINGIDENKNVTITAKKIRKQLARYISEERNIEITRKNAEREIEILEKYIPNQRQEISELDSKIRRMINKKNELTTIRNGILDQVVEQNETIQEKVNKGYTKVRTINE